MPSELPPETDPRQWFAAAARRRRLAERAGQEEGFTLNVRSVQAELRMEPGGTRVTGTLPLVSHRTV